MERFEYLMAPNHNRGLGGVRTPVQAVHHATHERPEFAVVQCVDETPPSGDDPGFFTLVGFDTEQEYEAWQSERDTATPA